MKGGGVHNWGVLRWARIQAVVVCAPDLGCAVSLFGEEQPRPKLPGICVCHAGDCINISNDSARTCHNPPSSHECNTCSAAPTSATRVLQCLSATVCCYLASSVSKSEAHAKCYVVRVCASDLSWQRQMHGALITGTARYLDPRLYSSRSCISLRGPRDPSLQHCSFGCMREGSHASDCHARRKTLWENQICNGTHRRTQWSYNCFWIVPIPPNPETPSPHTQKARPENGHTR